MESLEPTVFVPSLAYVKEVLGTGDVPAYTQWWKTRRRIYMATGVRTAKGAALVDKAEAQRDGKVFIEADGSAHNVPIQAGIGGAWSAGESHHSRRVRIADFVFAYRLHEIIYKLWVSKKPVMFGETSAARDRPSEASDVESEEVEPDGYEVKDLVSDPFEGLRKKDDPELFE